MNKLKEEMEFLQRENERLDKAVFESEQRLDRLQNIIIKMIEGNTKNISKDIEYICLKLFIDQEKYNEMLTLSLKMEIDYRQTEICPSIQQYHDLVVRTLGILEDDVENFTIENTLSIVKENAESKELLVFVKMLEEYNKNK